MIEKRSGLIVNISSFGGLKYLFNVPYGVGKAALDRMTQDTAVELKKHNVAVIGVWPGPVKTEAVNEKILGNSGSIKIYEIPLKILRCLDGLREKNQSHVIIHLRTI